MKSNSIKMWKNDERPREKMIDYGKNALSLAELLAILIGTGVNIRNKSNEHYSKSAVDLGKEILALGNGRIDKISRLSIEELQQINGIGPAKAISITAALELGQRRYKAGTKQVIKKIASSKDAYEVLRNHVEDLQIEQFWVLFLSRSNCVIRTELISQGGLTATLVDPGPLFKKAILNNASAIILCHNHPSGNLNPSNADLKLTQKIVNAGNLLDIDILDHLIITSTYYTSLNDQGKMKLS